MDTLNGKLSALLGNRKLKTVTSRSAPVGEVEEAGTMYGVRTLSEFSRRIEEERASRPEPIKSRWK